MQVRRQFDTIFAAFLALAAVAAGAQQVTKTVTGHLERGETCRSSAEEPSTRPATRAATQPAEVATSGPHWSMFRGNPHQTGIAGSTLPEELVVRWKYELGDATSSTAAIVGGTVYVGADDGKLSALDLRSGQLKWRHETGAAIESSPTVVGGLIVFGDDAGVLHACDAQTGQQRWTFQTKGRIVSSVNHADGRLVFGSYDGYLYCLRADDGSLIWKHDVQERVHGTPGIAEGYVLAAGCDACLHVVPLVRESLVREPLVREPLLREPLVRESLLAPHPTPPRKIALGSVTASAVAVHGPRVFLGMYAQQVLGVDWQAGKVVWRFEDEERSSPFLSSAAVTEDLIIIGGRDKRLRALDGATGKQRWQFVTKGRIDSSPVVVGQRVFVGSADGNLYAVELKTGKESWRFEAGGSISASAAVGEGCLVIGTEDGVVYCFGGKAGPDPAE